MQAVRAIKSQRLQPDKVLVIDSGSSDNTVQIASEAGFDVHSIAPSEFGHGRTRQLAVDMLPEFELLVFLTHDALLADVDALEKLIMPLKEDNMLAAVCGRQLPHENACVFAQHLRAFNYPSQSHVYSIDDIVDRGIRAAFMSNSFAAYRRSLLMDVGGFPQDVIMGEDAYVAAKMLLKGYQLAYNAESCVHHSHYYSFFGGFKRYFDIGVFHSREAWFIAELGKPGSEGRKYVGSEWRYIWRHNPVLLPEMCVRIMYKYAGYKVGRHEKLLPVWLKKCLSVNKRYW